MADKDNIKKKKKKRKERKNSQIIECLLKGILSLLQIVATGLVIPSLASVLSC